MKNKTRILAGILSLLFFAGCGEQTDTNNNSSTQSTEQTEITEQSLSTTIDVSQMFTDRDYKTDYDENSSTTITLNGDTAQCESDTVKISGSTVTISDEGTYILSGTLDNGMVIVNAENTDKIQLVLDGATINSNTSAAIYIAQADKVFLTLAENSENTLSNGGEFIAIDDNNIDATIFSKDDLTLNGSGSLTVTSPVGHGIVSKDDLVVTGGEYEITSASQGLCGKESIRIADGIFRITAGKDGIHAENTDDASLGFVYLAAGTYDITAEGDGISASSHLQIDNGNFTVKTGGGSETITIGSDGNWNWERPGGQQQTDTTEEAISAKGFKASGNFLVNNGTFYVDSADDALHSNANLTVNGGTWKISSGDDGLHADETMTVTNGTITITKSYEGIEGQNISISGGAIDLIASDDGLNAAGGNDQSGSGGFGGFQKGGFDTASDSIITISGGTLHINASGDGIDSNGSLNISGGETYVSGPTNDGNGILDYSGEAKISGGVFIAAGSSGMAQNFGTASVQGAMMVSVSGSTNDIIKLTDNSGEELLSWTADKSFSCVLISCPEIEQGETYTVTVGNSSQKVTMDSLIYGSGGGMGGGSGGGMSGKPGDKGTMSPRL
ncbi:MAG: carbohydrate-binding domain-containing protein [Oscillospiraceae bacterium]|jgi:hypothetical protein